MLHPVRRIDHLPLVMDDGVVLSAAVLLPDVPGPWSAVLDAVPYRKDDDFRWSDHDTYAYLAARGFACVRLDLRGTGSSRGILTNEYTERELDDVCEAIRQIASQDWCTGRVGMTGVSWGGFNAIQVATRRPAELLAVAPIHFSVDRYRADVHYVYGTLQVAESVVWPGEMVAENALPPHPQLVGEDWEAVWLDRLERTPQWPVAKLEHPRRDAYWHHGSACEAWESIDIPVLAIGGFIDGYQDACFAVLEHVRAPRRVVLGPWAHTRPHNGWPGPTFEHRDLLTRWFDRWLNDVRNGVDTEPEVVAYLRDGAPREVSPARVAGRWHAYRAPLQALRRTLHLDGTTLAERPASGGPRTWRGPQWVGHGAPWWSAGGPPTGHGADMLEDDAGSLVYDTPPLHEPLAILGRPRVSIEVSADRPVALVAARLEDVDPAGGSALICRGGLNLTHRSSDEEPAPLVPGQRYLVEIPLSGTGTVVPVGHRLRLALAGSDWPIAWPAPEPFSLTIHGGSIDLPIADPAQEVPAPAMPERDDAGAPPNPATPLPGPPAEWERTPDPETGRTSHRVTGGWDTALPDGGRSFGSHEVVCTIDANDPLSCRATARNVAEVTLPGVDARATGTIALSCTATTFDLAIDLVVERDGRPFWSRSLRRSFPRDLM